MLAMLAVTFSLYGMCEMDTQNYHISEQNPLNIWTMVFNLNKATKTKVVCEQYPKVNVPIQEWCDCRVEEAYDGIKGMYSSHNLVRVIISWRRR